MKLFLCIRSSRFYGVEKGKTYQSNGDTFLCACRRGRWAFTALLRIEGSRQNIGLHCGRCKEHTPDRGPWAAKRLFIPLIPDQPLAEEPEQYRELPKEIRRVVVARRRERERLPR